jgi:peptide subunit release factor RF-3
VLYSIDGGRTDPILAAVGQLQFEVCIQFTQYAVFSTIAVKNTLKTSFGQASLSSDHST